MKKLAANAQKKKIKNVISEVSSKDKRVNSFYEKCGFKKYGKHKVDKNFTLILVKAAPKKITQTIKKRTMKITYKQAQKDESIRQDFLNEYLKKNPNKSVTRIIYNKDGKELEKFIEGKVKTGQLTKDNKKNQSNKTKTTTWKHSHSAPEEIWGWTNQPKYL